MTLIVYNNTGESHTGFLYDAVTVHEGKADNKMDETESMDGVLPSKRQERKKRLRKSIAI